MAAHLVAPFLEGGEVHLLQLHTRHVAADPRPTACRQGAPREHVRKHLDPAIGDAVESEAQVLTRGQSLVERRGCEGDGAGVAPSVGIEAERIELLACARAQSVGDGDHARVCTLRTRE